MQDTDYLEGFQCVLPESSRILPSYQKIIGTKHGQLTINRVLRKDNRNILDCTCSCGRRQFLYRWQLKERLSCSVCGKYTQQYIYSKAELDKQFFKSIKQQCDNFQINYNYANKLLKKQHHRCAYTGMLLFAIKDHNNCVLDKINPQKGYVKDNVQWVSSLIGKMKGNLNNKQFLKLCNKIVDRKNNVSKQIKELNQKNIFC